MKKTLLLMFMLLQIFMRGCAELATTAQPNAMPPAYPQGYAGVGNDYNGQYIGGGCSV